MNNRAHVLCPPRPPSHPSHPHSTPTPQIELKGNQADVERALAEFIFRHAPDVAIVNAGQGRRPEFMRDAIDRAWRTVRSCMALTPGWSTVGL